MSVEEKKKLNEEAALIKQENEGKVNKIKIKIQFLIS